ncbi:MAG: hypothetical protein PWQ34_2159, partial [Caldanaerobacter sp.]|nr:hypothetical protein [Caldanaerobacter sp.]
ETRKNEIIFKNTQLRNQDNNVGIYRNEFKERIQDKPRPK